MIGTSIDAEILCRQAKRIDIADLAVTEMYTHQGKLIRATTYVGIDYGYHGFPDELSFDKPAVFSCCIWNRKWDLKQADECLLERVLEFHLHMA